MIEYTVKVYDGGYVMWFMDGKLHREDGPAIEWAGGDREWYLNGKRHREDGPAVERADGYKEWYLNNKRVTESDHAEQTAPTVEMTTAEICKAFFQLFKLVK